MTTNRIWTFGAILVIVAVLAATWFLGISPQFAAAGAAADERTSVETQNTAQEATLAELKKKFDTIDEIKAELDEARLVIPSARDKSRFSKQVDQLATKYGVTVTALTFADPVPYTPGASDDPELSVALGMVNPSNFLVIAVDVRVVGATTNVLNFIQAIQTGQRLFLLHNLQMDEGVFVGKLPIDVLLTGQTFVLLDAASVPVPEPTETPAPTDEG